MAFVGFIACFLTLTLGLVTGQSSGECNCVEIWQPVCGTDGQTYSNTCFAKCAEVPVARKGECSTNDRSTDCMCTKIYDAVCGINGQTYSNACVMECAGIAIRHQGPCPDSEPSFQ